jgi:hypothetical protein
VNKSSYLLFHTTEVTVFLEKGGYTKVHNLLAGLSIDFILSGASYVYKYLNY